MKSFSRFKRWLSRVTASVFLTESVMRDKLEEVKNIHDLIRVTSVWKPGTLAHNTGTSPTLRVAIRRLMMRHGLGVIDANCRVRFEHMQRVSDTNAVVYDISVSDDKNNWTTIDYSVLANYDDHELYIVDNVLIHGPTCVPSMI